MEKIQIYDIVFAPHKETMFLGVVVDKTVDFDGEISFEASEVLLENNAERLVLPDSVLRVVGKLHTPFTWRDVVHVRPNDDTRERFYGVIDGISWEPASDDWWFSVLPLQGGEAEMFGLAELSATRPFDFVK